MHVQMWVFAKARYGTTELEIEPQWGGVGTSMRTDIVIFPFNHTVTWYLNTI